jgi:hypothetical protein
LETQRGSALKFQWINKGIPTGRPKSWPQNASKCMANFPKKIGLEIFNLKFSKSHISINIAQITFRVIRINQFTPQVKLLTVSVIIIEDQCTLSMAAWRNGIASDYEYEYSIRRLQVRPLRWSYTFSLFWSYNCNYQSLSKHPPDHSVALHFCNNSYIVLSKGTDIDRVDDSAFIDNATV